MPSVQKTPPSTILWIDDDLEASRLVASQLLDLGIDLIHAASLRQAQEVMKREGTRLKAVLVDVALDSTFRTTPSAFEFLRRLRDRVPIVGVSSSFHAATLPVEFGQFTTLTKERAVHRSAVAFLTSLANQQDLPSESANTDEKTLLRVVQIPTIDLAVYRELVQHPYLLKTLDWRAFEQLLADILERLGYEVELQRGTKDGGIDIFALRNDTQFGPHRYLLQAKRYKDAVGLSPVRELLFLHGHHQVTKSCLATTAHFTRGAWELANQYQWQLELRDQNGLQEWLRQVMKQRDLT